MLLHSIILYAGMLLVPTTLAVGSVCNSGVYAALQPFKNYQPAQAFCSNKYPPGPSLRFEKRGPTTAARKTSTKVTTAAARPTNNKNAELYSSLSKAAASVAKTLCSCIQSPTTTTTAAPSSTPLPDYSCDLAFNYDTGERGSACGDQLASCNCFKSTSGRNYCTNRGSNGIRDCTQDSDCGEGFFCATQGCFGNVCVVITTQCDNTNGPYNLFKR